YRRIPAMPNAFVGSLRLAPAAVAALVLAVAAPALADAPAPGDDITLERIMADPDWIGNSPQNAYWSDDGTTIYFEKKANGAERRDLYRQGLEPGAAARAVADAERGRVDQPGGAWSPDFRWKAVLHEGDVFVKEVATGKLRQLTRTSAQESA